MKMLCVILILIHPYCIKNFRYEGVSFLPSQKTRWLSCKLQQLKSQGGSLHKEIPILCYHNIRNNLKPGDYTISERSFREQMKALADSGFHTIQPDLLYRYLTVGAILPPKPVIISFDDTHAEHFFIAAPVLEEFNFRGVFFIMTICIGKPGYLTADQIKKLSERGHTIGSHTWDHRNVKQLKGSDWEVEVTRPILTLEKITGKSVSFFAYPSGIWDTNAIAELKKRGIKASFQLYGKKNEEEKLFTIRRIIAPGYWSGSKLVREIKTIFKY